MWIHRLCLWLAQNVTWSISKFNNTICDNVHGLLGKMLRVKEGVQLQVSIMVLMNIIENFDKKIAIEIVTVKMLDRSIGQYPIQYIMHCQSWDPASIDIHHPLQFFYLHFSYWSTYLQDWYYLLWSSGQLSYYLLYSSLLWISYTYCYRPTDCSYLCLSAIYSHLLWSVMPLIVTTECLTDSRIKHYLYKATCSQSCAASPFWLQLSDELILFSVEMTTLLK